MQLEISRRAALGALAGSVSMAAMPALAREPLPAEAALWQGLALEDADGRAFQLGSGSARVRLVAMWANWCPACAAEMPSLVAMARALAPHVEVVLLSHPEWWAQDRAIAARRQIPLRLATASAANGAETVRAALTVGGSYQVPRTLAFRARDGMVAWMSRGSMDWAAAEPQARVRALLG